MSLKIGFHGTIIAETKEVLTYANRYFKKIHLIGYSFGAFVASHSLNQNSGSTYEISMGADHFSNTYESTVADLILNFIRSL